MKVAVLDSAALAALSPTAVSTYLRSRGWSPRDAELDMSIFARPENGELAFEVPLRQSARDYALRVLEVLQNLEAFESRSQLDIYSDIQQATHDVVRVTVGVKGTGRIGLDEGALLFASARDLLLASACSAHARRAYYPRRKPQRAVEYLQKVRLAAPASGSFVVLIESPIAPVLRPQPPPLDDIEHSADEPFERQALLTLVGAGAAIRSAIGHSATHGSLDAFSDSIGNGVTANYCDALARLVEYSDAPRVSIGVSWAAARPMRQPIPAQHTFFPDDAEYLWAASKYLKERAPIAGYELIGQVVKLKSDALAIGGEITVAGMVDDAIRQVAVSLGPNDYQTALAAHQTETVVSVEGELVRDGRSYRLLNPTMFSMV